MTRKRKPASSITPAKIAAPRVAQSYPRRRLFRMLDRARRTRIVFVSAPAGAGKTWLVASYLKARRLPALWYNVDARDADVANLFDYMALAARAKQRSQKLSLPTFAAENQGGAAAFARTFFESLSKRRPIPSAIVFDDYQEARSRAWDEVVGEGLRALPEGIVAFIISPGNAPPFFARHIAAREAILLRRDDLRLTTAEALGLIRVHRESDFTWEEDREHAIECLRRGFSAARQRGYFNAFWLRRVTMTNLAVRALDHGIETAHVRAWIVRHGLAPERASSSLEMWPWRYRMRALGSFELIADGSSYAGAKAPAEPRASGLRGMPLRLLQAILAFGGRGVPESELMDALWRDSEGDAARPVFDTTLHRLRRQLGNSDVVHLREGRVFLDDRVCWTDVWALADLFAEIGRELQTGAKKSNLPDLAYRLVTVYRGPLLGDESELSWALVPREKLTSKFLNAAERLGGALEENRMFSEAEALYRHALDVHPLAERCCVGLMRCAAATRRTADAASAFEEYRNRLANKREAAPAGKSRRCMPG